MIGGSFYLKPLFLSSLKIYYLVIDLVLDEKGKVPFDNSF